MATFCLLLSAFCFAVAQTVHPRHELSVTLDPATHRLTVTDRATLPAGRGGRPEFLLNACLTIVKSTPAVDAAPLGDVRSFGEAGTAAAAPLKRYRFRSVPADGVVTIEYAGAMDFGLSSQKEEYTRGFRETAGTISDKGVYLAGGSAWYPQFAADLVEFDLEVKAPAGWQVISQGSGTSGSGTAHWTSHDPMDEIYLVGGPLQVTRDRAGQVETLVYLHEKDDELAAKYLKATADYLDMFGRLVGPYPYDKFALVENFWETGYGMPSFTLLGPEIIRFPFILNSSFPHEILHNWWGNSVFVEYHGGNWSEGLTAYLADHLVQEQQGKGADYRRATLQKYRDYVKDGRDFPLTAFTSRDTAATEAVGYGKTLMLFHMLRGQLGDQQFRQVLGELYHQYRGKRAGWNDIRAVAESVAGERLSRFFDEWLARPGAPAFEVRVSPVGQNGAIYTISGALAQVQGGRPYSLVVPIAVQTTGGFIHEKITVSDAAGTFEVSTRDRPLVLYVDPYFDVFRRLDPRETPPSIGQVFGESRILAVLPSKGSPAMLAAYREMLKGWQTATHAIAMKMDSEVTELPSATTLWLLGRENTLASALYARQPGLTMDDKSLTIDGRAVPRANHTAVLMTRHPASPDKRIGWIVVDPIEALPGLGRKLPHYGKYSYVAFEGAEPTNVMSGDWRDVDSPLRVDLRSGGVPSTLREPQGRPEQGRGATGSGQAASTGWGGLAPLPPDPARALIQNW